MTETVATFCARHPGVAAAFTCRRCGGFSCVDCEIPHPDARDCCVVCAPEAITATRALKASSLPALPKEGA